MTRNIDIINLVSAASAIIGYTSSLKEGQVSEGYIQRLNNYYVSNLEKAVEAITNNMKDK